MATLDRHLPTGGLHGRLVELRVAAATLRLEAAAYLTGGAGAAALLADGVVTPWAGATAVACALAAAVRAGCAASLRLASADSLLDDLILGGCERAVAADTAERRREVESLRNRRRVATALEQLVLVAPARSPHGLGRSRVPQRVRADARSVVRLLRDPARRVDARPVILASRLVVEPEPLVSGDEAVACGALRRILRLLDEAQETARGS